MSQLSQDDRRKGWTGMEKDCIIRHPSQKHQIQWFGAYEKRVGDASAFLTAYFGLWHRMGLAEEHRVHMRDSQTHHAPAVG